MSPDEGGVVDVEVGLLPPFWGAVGCEPPLATGWLAPDVLPAGFE